MKAFGKFIWRVAKSMLGSVACVALIGFSGYFISLGLNKLTGVIMEFLLSAAKYLMGNWVAVIVVVIALTIGGIAFESVVNWFKSRRDSE